MSAAKGIGTAEPPRHYLAHWVDRPVRISGRMDDPLWEGAPWSDEFVDILGDQGPRPRYRTRFKLVWGDEYLTIGAEMEEPHVWATLTEHDSVIFQDNDFEVFLDPDGDGQLYGELEINAFNTTWDLLLIRPYRAHGAAISGWEIRGLLTAVGVDGTINDPRDIDRGWTVEIAIPWASLAELARRELPPDDGDIWRINFSRVEWEVEVVEDRYRKTAGLAEMNWVWSPQGAVDMHLPHRWGVLEFSRSGERRFAKLPCEQRVLADALGAQMEYRAATGRWATCAEELNAASHTSDVGFSNELRVEATHSLLEMSLGAWRIDHHSRLWQE